MPKGKGYGMKSGMKSGMGMAGSMDRVPMRGMMNKEMVHHMPMDSGAAVPRVAGEERGPAMGAMGRMNSMPMSKPGTSRR